RGAAQALPTHSEEIEVAKVMKKLMLSVGFAVLLATSSLAQGKSQSSNECRQMDGELHWFAVTYLVYEEQAHRVPTDVQDSGTPCTVADYEQSRTQASRWGEIWPALQMQNAAVQQPPRDVRRGFRPVVAPQQVAAAPAPAPSMGGGGGGGNPPRPTPPQTGGNNHCDHPGCLGNPPRPAPPQTGGNNHCDHPGCLANPPRPTPPQTGGNHHCDHPSCHANMPPPTPPQTVGKHQTPHSALHPDSAAAP